MFGGLFVLTILVGLFIFFVPFRTVTFDPIESPGFRLPSGLVLFLGGLAALSMATISIILDWSALWLTRDLGLAIALGGTGIMAFNVAEIVSRLYGEALINRFGEVFVAGWGMILGCVIFLVTAVLGNPYLIVVGFGFFTANFIPVLFGVAAREETDNAVAAVNVFEQRRLERRILPSAGDQPRIPGPTESASVRSRRASVTSRSASRPRTPNRCVSIGVNPAPTSASLSRCAVQKLKSRPGTFRPASTSSRSAMNN